MLSFVLDPTTLKRMLKPMPSAESPVTSPEMGRRRYNYYNANIINAPPPPPPHLHPHAHILNNNATSRGSNQSSLCNKR